MASFKMILASCVIRLVLDIYKSESNPVYFQCEPPNIKYKFSDLNVKELWPRHESEGRGEEKE
jgi:hypothetical protein